MVGTNIQVILLNLTVQARENQIKTIKSKFASKTLFKGKLRNIIRTEAMEENVKLIETLLEKVVDYGKTTYELEKLKALDKSSDIASSLIPHTAVFILIASFLLCVNFGLALWLGEVLGRIFYGFFVVGAFYVVASVIVRFLMLKWLKKIIRNYIIKQALK